MAITREYGPAVDVLARSAYKAGGEQGQYEKERAEQDAMIRYLGISMPIKSQEKMQDKSLEFSRDELRQTMGFKHKELTFREKELADRLGLSYAELAQAKEISDSRLNLDTQRLSFEDKWTQGSQTLQGRGLDIQEKQVSNQYHTALQGLANQISVANINRSNQWAPYEAQYQTQANLSNQTAHSLGYGTLLGGTMRAPTYTNLSSQGPLGGRYHSTTGYRI